MYTYAYAEPLNPINIYMQHLNFRFKCKLGYRADLLIRTLIDDWSASDYWLK